ncbi:hypothetical protein O181_060608 [Austropuccinia psidii MF-1]|uniref:Uncharacterized protein n=1 Tax=Austropuccinia psidii MF-1 TaxID=1389203 RepID=A0A9Q3EGR6_9BASI|nr:hypothetical protein [Austropuccinia psidii MF-1]
MVHTRNGINYSVQPNGSGKGRAKTRARSGKSFSRNTYLEDARVAPNYPRSVPTNVDVNSDPELTQGNILRVEPFPSGSHKNISVPVQNLIQSIQGRGVGNIPKPLAGGHEILLTHQEISGSGEDHRNLRRQEEGVGNEPSFVERRPIGIYQRQTSSRNVQRQAQRTSEQAKVQRAIRARAKAKAIGTDLTHKGTGSPNWNLQKWTVFSIWPELLGNSQPKSRKG